MNQLIRDLKQVGENLVPVREAGTPAKKFLAVKEIKDKLTLDALKFLYDKNITTGISKKKWNRILPIDPRIDDISLYELMDYLKENNTGKDEIISRLQNLTSFLGYYEEFLFTEIVTKDPRMGLSIKSLNKAFGNTFLPQHEVMLADKYLGNEDKLKGSFSLTLKIDGYRCSAEWFHGYKRPILKARSGKVIEGCYELENAIMELPQGFMYDGEIVTIEDSANSNDTFNKTSSIVSKKGKKDGIKIVLFDVLSQEEWEVKKCDVEYYDRRNFLEDCVNNSFLGLLEVAECFYCGNDKNLIDIYLKTVKDNGEEGLMINTKRGMYEFKRSKNLLKVKPFKIRECTILGFNEGEGELSGTLGSLIAEFGEDNSIVNVSGISKELRDKIWNNKDLYEGIIVDVKYFEETKNKNGTRSLRFPSLERLRFDKLERNNNE